MSKTRHIVFTHQWHIDYAEERLANKMSWIDERYSGNLGVQVIAIPERVLDSHRYTFIIRMPIDD